MKLIVIVVAIIVFAVMGALLDELEAPTYVYAVLYAFWGATYVGMLNYSDNA